MPINCPNCGAENPDNTEKCKYCGSNLQETFNSELELDIDENKWNKAKKIWGNNKDFFKDEIALYKKLLQNRWNSVEEALSAVEEEIFFLNDDPSFEKEVTAKLKPSTLHPARWGCGWIIFLVVGMIIAGLMGNPAIMTLYLIIAILWLIALPIIKIKQSAQDRRIKNSNYQLKLVRDYIEKHKEVIKGLLEEAQEHSNEFDELQKYITNKMPELTQYYSKVNLEDFINIYELKVRDIDHFTSTNHNLINDKFNFWPSDQTELIDIVIAKDFLVYRRSMFDNKNPTNPPQIIEEFDFDFDSINSLSLKNNKIVIDNRDIDVNDEIKMKVYALLKRRMKQFDK